MGDSGSLRQGGDAAPSKRATVRRLPQRAAYDRATIHRILDEGLICHVGFVVDGAPRVIPTAYARWNESLILHGSKASRMLQTLAAGTEACVTVTLLDGLVLARSAFHHSMNYRSVVAFGKTRRIDDVDEKQRAFTVLVEHLVPGRGRDAREPNTKEIDSTELLEFPLTEVSAKVRTGPPLDSEDDKKLGMWAGVVPLALQAGTPVADPELAAGVAVPEYARAYVRP